QHEARALFHQLADIFEVLGNHARSPPNSRVIFAAISPIGSTADARPALVTWPGMPQTTLVASSCAMTEPPAATISFAPRKPSDPIPVSTSPSTHLPQTAAADANSGSTD